MGHARFAKRLLAISEVAALALFPAPGIAAPLDAFCKSMMDRAAEIWPLAQVRQCSPWRKRHQAALNQTAATCRKKDPLSDACDKLDDAATRFWMESEYVEKNRDVPASQANPLLPKSP